MKYLFCSVLVLRNNFVVLYTLEIAKLVFISTFPVSFFKNLVTVDINFQAFILALCFAFVKLDFCFLDFLKFLYF